MMQAKRQVRWCWLAVMAIAGWLSSHPLMAAEPGVVLEEFIYDDASFPECHAATLAETPQGIVAAWFGGTAERNPDVGIWISRREADRWTAPKQVADGVQSATERFPCWNPVLYQVPNGRLLLFYKVGPSPEAWWGMLKSSGDHGATWSEATRLPDGMLGPIKNKPIPLKDGQLLSGTSDESDGWIAFVEFCDVEGEHWRRSAPLNTKDQFGAIQPTILRYADGRLQLLCRTRERVVSETWSSDEGQTWSPMQATTLPNPNSGIDGVTLTDGRQLLVYNHSVRHGLFPAGREVLNVATTRDGQEWNAVVRLEKHPAGEFSYPAVIQSADGMVHILYTHDRKKIKHVVLDPSKLVERPIVNSKWPE
ncbi:MAG: sialidase family protein [Pirellulales bacterium]